MQKRVYKLIVLTLISILSLVQISDAQEVETKLEVADSLFGKRMYTQSLEIYEEIYLETESASPAMLLKMAYSQEAMGNLSQALIYLHDYYRVTSDKEVLEKMDELAQVNGLEGYESNDFVRFLKSLEDYSFAIIGALLAMGLLILSMIFRKLKKHGEKSPGLAISLVLVLGLNIFFINFFNKKDLGIISNKESYIMSGPSAAAELVEVVGEGHKVEILDKTDIWYEIIWRGGRGFIRENNLEKLL